jgi:hypothetical protein
VLPAAGSGLRRFGRWLAAWGRRLAPNPFLWVGLVLGFGTSLLVWESVLLLGTAVWLLGVWLWKARGRSALVALGLGLVLGWLPVLFFFVDSLPHTMIGLPASSTTSERPARGEAHGPGRHPWSSCALNAFRSDVGWTAGCSPFNASSS